MSHTPEPWDTATHEFVNGNFLLSPEDFNHAAFCVTNCANLNPTAYRECVEALEAARIFLPKDSDVMRQADEAIKHTQEPI